MPLVAGADCSTQATKVVVVDADGGHIVARGDAPHEVTGTDGARETDPGVWREALGHALRATGRAGELAAIAVGGQQHGLVVHDADGEPLRPALLWNDTRSAPQAERLTVALGGARAWAERVGVVPVASITATKWAWLREHEPARAAAASGVCLPHDWLNGQLVGSPTTDRGDASGTGWWSSHSESYDEELLERLELDVAALPPVHGPADPAGEVDHRGAERFGLPRGIPVGAGTGDNMAAALALGVAPGTPVMSLGTSGTVYAVSEQPVVDPSGTVAGFADATGRWLPLACTLNCTLAVDRIAALLGLERDAIADRTDVTLLPYLDGERTPNHPGATGTLVGLRHDTPPEAVLRAAYEGAAGALLAGLDELDALGSGLDPSAPLILVGGGARGEAWRSIVRALSGRALRVPSTEEHVALGAAAQAAAALTGREPVDVARDWDHAAGDELPAVPRDEEALARLRSVVSKAAPLLEEPFG
ncbi:xylulokinase [Egibacter rhizosphaerae]|uniref:Xylulose kinase n=1 Tax=Egibacter rhizosphaerae TaxID=1670831 RepID=A0A411YH66_9ACTN|nr:xylulokinase [Egibacter rhizosphaerae]QBI20608.1 xylulokinase [Egibacter rhizosphaerae]